MTPLLSMAAAVLGAALLPSTAMGQAAESSACPASDVRAPRAGPGSDSASSNDALVVPAQRSPAASEDPVDVAIIASASASAVRFARQPEIRVRLCGGLDSVRVIERRNLPERIVAGQTYRDVYIAVEILGRVDAACLARRLGVAHQSDTTSGMRPAVSEGCAAIKVGGAVPPPAAVAPTTGASRMAPPGTEDAPARGQVTPVRP